MRSPSLQPPPHHRNQGSAAAPNAEDEDFHADPRTRHVFHKGEHLYLEDDQPSGLWQVLSGRVDVKKTHPDGKTTLMESFRAGDTVCLAACLRKRPYPCSAVAGEDVEAVLVPQQEVQRGMNTMPPLAQRLTTRLAEEYCLAHRAVAAHAETVDKRLAHILLDLDQRCHGCPIPFTREELAQMANTSTETCIRTLSPWISAGWIHGKRGNLRVLNSEALREAAE